MYKYIALVLLAALILVGVASASVNIKFDITKPVESASFLYDGSKDVTVSVKNTGTEAAYAVNLSATAEGLTVGVSPSSATIEAGSTADFIVSISGTLCKRTVVKLKVAGKDVGGSDEDASSKFYLATPDKHLEFTYPDNEIKLVDFPENGSWTFEAKVRNKDMHKTYCDISVNAKPGPKISCSVSTGAQCVSDVEVGYSITCSNISTGKRAQLEIRDGCNIMYDVEAFEFTLVEGFRDLRVEILSPVENEEIRVGEFGGMIGVDVANIGMDDVTGICLSVEGMSFASEQCADINAGQKAIFNLSLFPTEETTFIKIKASDNESIAKDEVGVRVIMTPAIKPPVVCANACGDGICQNVSCDTDGCPCKEGPENCSVDCNKVPYCGDFVCNGADTCENCAQDCGACQTPEPTGGFIIPIEVFMLIIIIVPLVILGVYIKKSVAKAGD